MAIRYSEIKIYFPLLKLKFYFDFSEKLWSSWKIHIFQNMEY